MPQNDGNFTNLLNDYGLGSERENLIVRAAQLSWNCDKRFTGR